MLAEKTGLFVSEMRFRVYEGNGASFGRMPPGPFHEASVEVGLQSSEQWIGLC